MDELRGQVKAASVAVPTEAHGEVGGRLLEMGIDVLVEKPMAANLQQADALLEAAKKNGRILQVGHVETIQSRGDCRGAHREPAVIF